MTSLMSIYRKVIIMSKRISQDVVGRFLTITEQDPFSSRDKSLVDKSSQLLTPSVLTSQQEASIVKKIKKSKQSSFGKDTKILRTYNIPKSLYLSFMKVRLNNGDIGRDISAIIRDELEKFLSEILGGKAEMKRQQTSLLKENQKCEMVNKGFYLTERLIDAIKVYSFVHRENDSRVIRLVIQNYVDKKIDTCI